MLTVESYHWSIHLISSVVPSMGYMQRSRPLESNHYSVHGPQSTITLCIPERRVSYGPNFKAQIPESIGDRLGDDYRELVGADLLNYFIELGENLAK